MSCSISGSLQSCHNFQLHNHSAWRTLSACPPLRASPEMIKCHPFVFPCLYGVLTFCTYYCHSHSIYLLACLCIYPIYLSINQLYLSIMWALCANAALFLFSAVTIMSQPLWLTHFPSSLIIPHGGDFFLSLIYAHKLNPSKMGTRKMFDKYRVIQTISPIQCLLVYKNMWLAPYTQDNKAWEKIL